MSQDTAIGIIGVKKTLAILNEVDPEVRKALNATIKEALQPVRERAKAKYSKGSWVVRLNNKKILGQIAAGGGRYVSSSWSKSAPGVRAAIFEFAGSTTSGKTPQAAGLIKSLNSRYGSPGRFMWSAWDEVGDNALKEINTMIREAERNLQARLDTVKS